MTPALRVRASLGSLLFFIVAPGVVAGLVPWWITGWEVEPSPVAVRVAGIVLICVGIAALLYSFARFVVEGIGTPAPVAPTERLVVGGLYRYVRNPMYMAVIAIVVGEAGLLASPLLLVYALIAGVAMAVFAHFYEEPNLARRFGGSYETYKRNVPAWLPRLTPWENTPQASGDETRSFHSR